MNNLISIIKEYAPEVLTDKDYSLASTQTELEQLYTEQEMYIPEPEWYVHTKLFEEELDVSDDEALDATHPAELIPSVDFNPAYQDEMPGFTVDSESELEAQAHSSIENPLYFVDWIDTDALHFVLSMKNKETTQEVSALEVEAFDKPVVKSEPVPHFNIVDKEHNKLDWYTVIHKSNWIECFDEIIYDDNEYIPSDYSRHQELLMKAKVKLKDLRADEKVWKAKAKLARDNKDYDKARQYDKFLYDVSAKRRKISGLLDKYSALTPKKSKLDRWTTKVEQYLPKFVARQQRMLKRWDAESMKKLETFDRAYSAIKACGPKPQIN